ncbi:UNVERIFIED_CONTAM: Mce-associated membrane protein [Streptomyces graminofaciens]
MRGEEAGAVMSTGEDVATAVPGPSHLPVGQSEPPAGPSAGARPAGHRRWRTPAVAALALALLIGGSLFLLRAGQLTGAPSADNRALTDTEATARVTGDVSNALTSVFSYTPGDTAATREAAGELLAGKAARQYAELFGQVEKRAAEQKLTLTTHVVRAGVTRLDGSSAKLLVFLDQVSRREGGAPATAPAQLSVTAELDDGRWRIVDITSR